MPIEFLDAFRQNKDFIDCYYPFFISPEARQLDGRLTEIINMVHRYKSQELVEKFLVESGLIFHNDKHGRPTIWLETSDRSGALILRKETLSEGQLTYQVYGSAENIINWLLPFLENLYNQLHTHEELKLEERENARRILRKTGGSL